MKNKLILILILAVFLLNFVSADIIMSGEKPIAVENKITNLADFPDYVFFSVCSEFSNPKIVETEGIIMSHYKACGDSVYAIKKADFNETYFSMTLPELEEKMNQTSEYLNSISPKQVIKNVDSYETVRDSSSIEKIQNLYTINLNEIKDKPDKIITTRNNLIYYFIIIPIIALILILIVLWRRK